MNETKPINYGQLPGEDTVEASGSYHDWIAYGGWGVVMLESRCKKCGWKARPELMGTKTCKGE